MGLSSLVCFSALSEPRYAFCERVCACYVKQVNISRKETLS